MSPRFERTQMTAVRDVYIIASIVWYSDVATTFNYGLYFSNCSHTSFVEVLISWGLKRFRMSPRSVKGSDRGVSTY